MRWSIEELIYSIKIVLNRLIHGFEVMKSESIYLEVLYKEEDPEEAYRLQSEYDRTTMELFVKYFRDFWD